MADEIDQLEADIIGELGVNEAKSNAMSDFMKDMMDDMVEKMSRAIDAKPPTDEDQQALQHDEDQTSS